MTNPLSEPEQVLVTRMTGMVSAPTEVDGLLAATLDVGDHQLVFDSAAAVQRFAMAVDGLRLGVEAVERRQQTEQAYRDRDNARPCAGPRWLAVVQP